MSTLAIRVALTVLANTSATLMFVAIIAATYEAPPSDKVTDLHFGDPSSQVTR